jgi:vacuolar protein sorting-associated protein 8
MFVHTFVACNMPKYPQFIQMAPSVLYHPCRLTTDVDRSTHEDRQLAAEYLLSTYTPHDSEQLLRLFEDAGFYHILRTRHRQEGRWSPLLLAYLHDPDVQPQELFTNIDKIFTTTITAPTTARTRSCDSSVPADDLRATVAMALPDLLGASIIATRRNCTNTR